jgi:carbonic anhydrase
MPYTKVLVLLLLFVTSLPAAAKPSLEASIKIYRDRQAQATPSGVLEVLKAGNHRFATGRGTHGGYFGDARHRVQVSATGQRPLAVVLSCIDSRTSPELIFDTSVGDLFTARVGANVVNDDILGSLEIATESGAKVIVVLGHTDCGGIKGACVGLELGHMTQLLERVKPAIAHAHDELDQNPALAAQIGERVVTNRRYVAHVSHANAAQSTAQLLERSPILREKVAKGEILIVTAVFDVDSGRVVFDPLK